jgi:hypothetical protein
MRAMPRKGWRGGLIAMLLFCQIIDCAMADSPDFIIETPDGQFNYWVNGVSNNPTITLVRGHTYTFLVTNASPIHPVAFGDPVTTDPVPGVSGDNTTNGIITYAVPLTATNSIYYCVVHGFSGDIHVIDNPLIGIVGFKVDSNLTVTATIVPTNGLTVIPEFSTNLASANWFALTVQTNVPSGFSGMTNEVICGRPPGNTVLVRIRGQQSP